MVTSRHHCRPILRARLARLVPLAASASLGCSSADDGGIPGGGGSLGTDGNATYIGIGGSGQTDDSVRSKGGVQAMGGMTSVGGLTATGGMRTSVGSLGVGGTQGGGSPGSVATGGNTSPGGASNLGTRAGGGALQAGGTSSTGSGRPRGGTSNTTGVQTSGGTQALGGATSTVGGSTGKAGEYPLKNPPVPSTGCGKALSTFKNGTNTYKITSAGLNREYIVALPDNYDSDTPHRLVFGMHWMNGSADAVQGWSKWFGLKALDTDNSTIFVAPNGYGSNPLWTQGVKDHSFFDDLVKLLTSELCIDTSRVFSVGFSFGAMFTNSLAQTHQEVLRGVVLYAAADYNIYFPPNTGKPLAYMGVHGLKDPTCPIASGRSSRDRFVKNNGCTVPTTVPEARAGGDYVTYDYDCPSNYPVRWVTFDGKHTYPPNDTGTWVYGLTWQFITQF